MDPLVNNELQDDTNFGLCRGDLRPLVRIYTERIADFVSLGANSKFGQKFIVYSRLNIYS